MNAIIVYRQGFNEFLVCRDLFRTTVLLKLLKGGTFEFIDKNSLSDYKLTVSTHFYFNLRTHIVNSQARASYQPNNII